MTLRSMIGAAALTIAVSSVAFAASAPATTPTAAPAKTVTKIVMKGADRCASLEQQFKDAAAKNADSKKLPDAQKLADEGTKLCTEKKYSSGERKLIDALKELGEKAKV
jgi:hypothetical protein